MPGPNYTSNKIVGDNVVFVNRTGSTQINLSASGTNNLYIDGQCREALTVANPISETDLSAGELTLTGTSSILLDTPNLYISENIIMTPVDVGSSSNFQLTGIGANSIQVGSSSNAGTLVISANDSVFSLLEMGNKTALTSGSHINFHSLSGSGNINMTCSQLNVNNISSTNITTGVLRATNTISTNITTTNLNTTDIISTNVTTTNITTTSLNTTGATISDLNISSINSDANLTISNLSVTARTDLFDTYIDYATCVDMDSTRSNITDMQGQNLSVSRITTGTLNVTGNSIMNNVSLTGITTTNLDVTNLRTGSITTSNLQITNFSLTGLTTTYLNASSGTISSLNVTSIKAMGGNQEVQFNNGGVIGASAVFKFDPDTFIVRCPVVSAQSISGNFGTVQIGTSNQIIVNSATTKFQCLEGFCPTEGLTGTLDLGESTRKWRRGYINEIYTEKNYTACMYSRIGTATQSIANITTTLLNGVFAGTGTAVSTLVPVSGFDVGFTYSGGVFTITRAGIFNCYCGITYDPSSTNARLIYIYKNGAQLDYSQVASATGGYATRMTLYYQLYLAVNDTVSFYARQQSGGSLNVTQGVISIQRVADSNDETIVVL